METTEQTDLEWLEGLTYANIRQVCQEYCAWSSASGEPHACSVDSDRAEQIFKKLRDPEEATAPYKQALGELRGDFIKIKEIADQHAAMEGDHGATSGPG